MDIQKYNALLKTIEYGSITRAAEVLSYSQSGISRMIQEVEKELGLSLLERGRGGVRLTAEGTKLLPQIKLLCNAHQSLQQQADELKGLESGLIRIGTFSSVATHWLPNIIKEFQKDYPNIEYELLLGDYREIEGWIQEGRVDCGFLRLPTCRNLTPSFWNRTIFLLSFLGSIPWRKQRISLWRPSAKNLFCCWKRIKTRRPLHSSASMGFPPMSISPHGMITPSFPWWKADWASVCCPA